MKNLIIGLTLGFVLHMAYLDFILVRQHQIIDACPVDDKPDEDGTLPCLKYGNDTVNRYYLKYFGAYYLIKWNSVVTGPWRPE